ncbi:hypothetical protein L3C95_21740 [Chitinophaga filiformis]|uniref:hypothetical protein n=1 Tax=Chitinophaga filiformis TaxID=104663 RepID=UPI001F304F9D|nr:hypothetical protein [Chitinophaga filiformis]MCF6405534.1 hypothetical protein [Chitinophaga filiformis]MCF6405542.1 hypothetical protein [Chitinophaga filiformis]
MGIILPYSPYTDAHRIHYPADGSKIVLTLIRVLLLTFAQAFHQLVGQRSNAWQL